jgi:hypothetical protein
VRKKRVVLKDQADVARMCGKAGQVALTELDATAARLQKTSSPAMTEIDRSLSTWVLP